MVPQVCCFAVLDFILTLYPYTHFGVLVHPFSFVHLFCLSNMLCISHLWWKCIFILSWWKVIALSSTVQLNGVSCVVLVSPICVDISSISAGPGAGIWTWFSLADWSNSFEFKVMFCFTEQMNVIAFNQTHLNWEGNTYCILTPQFMHSNCWWKRCDNTSQKILPFFWIP